MKKIPSVIFASIVLFACKKEETPSIAIDYSQYKIKTATHSSRNYSAAPSSFSTDTTFYTYEGSTYKYTQRRSGTIYDYTATLSNGLYTQELYTNGTLSNQKVYYKLNTAGYIDSNWIASNSIVTQSSRNHYNTDGTLAAAAQYYSGYTNLISYNYKNGVADYAHSERIAYIPSIPNAKDSVAYEYAANLPYRADFYSTGLPTSFSGKPSKNLLQKAIYYDKLNSNAIRQTTEYQYQTDDIGLVTKRVFNIYTQPGNILMLTDTTVYTYYNK